MLKLKPRLLKKRRRKPNRKKRPPYSGVVAQPLPTPRYFLRSMASPSDSASIPERMTHPMRSKRSWSDTEDELLITLLLELHATGRYRADRGFKPGLFTAVEREFHCRMPGSGIRADLHIYSRVKTLKSHYNIITDMLYGSTSGFGWDPERKCVTAEDLVWLTYLQSHKPATQFRGHSFKYFEELNVIFGPDRAAGTGSTTCVDQVRNINAAPVSENNISQNIEESTAANISMDSAGTSNSRKRKADRDAGIQSVLRENNTEMQQTMRCCTRELCDAINEVNLSEQRSMFLEALRAMEFLTQSMRYRFRKIIGSDAQQVDMFLKSTPQEREAIVRAELGLSE